MFYQIPPIRYIQCLRNLLAFFCSGAFIEISSIVLKQVLNDLHLLHMCSLRGVVLTCTN